MTASDVNTYLEPADVVRRFIAEMHAWELQTAAAHKASVPEDYKAVWQASNESLEQVFASWCTSKDRPRGRLGSFQSPPEYQPDHEHIIETVFDSSRRAYVITQRQSEFGFKMRYVLLKQEGRWLIDNVKWQEPGDPEWSAGIL